MWPNPRNPLIHPHRHAQTPLGLILLCNKFRTTIEMCAACQRLKRLLYCPAMRWSESGREEAAQSRQLTEGISRPSGWHAGRLVGSTNRIVNQGMPWRGLLLDYLANTWPARRAATLPLPLYLYETLAQMPKFMHCSWLIRVQVDYCVSVPVCVCVVGVPACLSVSFSVPVLCSLVDLLWFCRPKLAKCVS